jgi:hypothetical protein
LETREVLLVLQCAADAPRDLRQRVVVLASTLLDTRGELKADVCLYTFAGTILPAAARLNQGQATNMRTPGGGFAPALEVRMPLEGS